MVKSTPPPPAKALTRKFGSAGSVGFPASGEQTDVFLFPQWPVGSGFGSGCFNSLSNFLCRITAVPGSQHILSEVRTAIGWHGPQFEKAQKEKAKTGGVNGESFRTNTHSMELFLVAQKN